MCNHILTKEKKAEDLYQPSSNQRITGRHRSSSKLLGWGVREKGTSLPSKFCCPCVNKVAPSMTFNLLLIADGPVMQMANWKLERMQFLQ